MKNIICEVKVHFLKYSSEIVNILIHSSKCMLFREKRWEEMQFWLKIIKEMMPWQ